MDTQNIKMEKEELKERICPRKATGIWEPLNKSEFLNRTWSGIVSSVILNRRHPLITQAIERYQDLIPRMYVYLLILHGAYSTHPTIKSILDDFVNHINNDLDACMEKICLYAASKDRYNAFSLEPYVLWQIIERISSKNDTLPFLITPHLAFTLFTLNRNGEIFTRCFCEETVGKDLRRILQYEEYQ